MSCGRHQAVYVTCELNDTYVMMMTEDGSSGCGCVEGGMLNN